MAATQMTQNQWGEAGVNDQADENRKGRGLGRGGHEGHHRRRRAFVNVRRPDVEGSAGDLEAEAGEDQGDGHEGQRLDVVAELSAAAMSKTLVEPVAP
jgi:hypothetical protein